MSVNDIANFQKSAPDELVQKARLNRQIANFLQKLSSYLVHPNDFKARTDDARKRFWGELVLTLSESELPHSVWTSTSAIRFCRREFKFFPCAQELCDALASFAEPIREAQRKEWEMTHLADSKTVCTNNAKLTHAASNYLGRYLEHKQDGFKNLAKERGSTPNDARQASRSLMKWLYPDAFKFLLETEQSPSSLKGHRCSCRIANTHVVARTLTQRTNASSSSHSRKTTPPRPSV